MSIFRRSKRRTPLVDEEQGYPTQSGGHISARSPQGLSGTLETSSPTSGLAMMANNVDHIIPRPSGNRLRVLARTTTAGFSASLVSDLLNHILGLMEHDRTTDWTAQQLQDLAAYVERTIDRISQTMQSEDVNMSEDFQTVVNRLLMSLRNIYDSATMALSDGPLRRILNADLLSMELNRLNDELERIFKEYMLLSMLHLQMMVEHFQREARLMAEAARERDEKFHSAVLSGQASADTRITLLTLEGQRAEDARQAQQIAEKHLRIGAQVALVFFFKFLPSGFLRGQQHPKGSARKKRDGHSNSRRST